MVVRIYDPKFPLDLSDLLDLRGGTVPLDVDQRILVIVDATDLLTKAPIKKIEITNPPIVSPPSDDLILSTDLFANDGAGSGNLTIGASVGLRSGAGAEVTARSIDGVVPIAAQIDIVRFSIQADLAHHVVAGYHNSGGNVANLGRNLRDSSKPQRSNCQDVSVNPASIAASMTVPILVSQTRAANTRYTYEPPQPPLIRSGMAQFDGFRILALSTINNVAMVVQYELIWRQRTVST